jgi:hypothetical protein
VREFLILSATGKRGRPRKYTPETVERLLAMHFGIVRRDPAFLFGCGNRPPSWVLKIF